MFSSQLGRIFQRERINVSCSNHHRVLNYLTPRPPRTLPCPLSDDELELFTFSCDQLLSPDTSTHATSLKELVSIVTHHGCSSFPLFDERHVTILVRLLSDPHYEYDSLRILQRLSTDPHLSLSFLSAGIFPPLFTFLSKPNSTFLIASIQIIGNCSSLSSDFRDSAFAANLFDRVAESSLADVKTRVWCLSTAFDSAPFPPLLCDQLLPQLLSIASSPRVNVTSQVTKVLEKLIENGFSEYRQILLEYRFLGNLVDIVAIESSRKVERAITILADCCLDGDELISQMLFHDVIRVVVMKLEREISATFVLGCLGFVENWLNSSVEHQFEIISGLCQPFFANFFRGTLFEAKVSAVRVLTRMAVLADFEMFLKVLTPECAVELVGMLCVDEELAIKWIFPVFRVVFERGNVEFLREFAACISGEISDELFVSENREIVMAAQLLRANIDTLLNDGHE
jgi:hypothetical protein